MRRIMILAALAALCFSIQMPAQAGPVQALLQGVEHAVGNLGPMEVHVIHIAPGAAVEIKAMRPVGGQTPAWQCQQVGSACLGAINGDLFDTLTMTPTGPMVSDGQAVKPAGVVAFSHQLLGLTPDNCFNVGQSWPAGVAQGTGASYTLVHNGQPQAINDPGQEKMVSGHSARTLVMWTRTPTGCDTHWVTVGGLHRGVTLAEATGVCLRFHPAECVNLDGGTSTAMAIGGQLVSPLQDGHTHPVANIWVLVAKTPQPPTPPPPPTTTTTIAPTTTTTVAPLPPVTVPVTEMKTHQMAASLPLKVHHSHTALQVVAILGWLAAETSLQRHFKRRRQKGLT